MARGTGDSERRDRAEAPRTPLSHVPHHVRSFVLVGTLSMSGPRRRVNRIMRKRETSSRPAAEPEAFQAAGAACGVVISWLGISRRRGMRDSATGTAASRKPSAATHSPGRRPR